MRSLLIMALLLGALAGPVVAATPSPAPLDSVSVATLMANVRNGACPLPRLATGGQPDSSTLVALARGGLRTVLDLRAPEEDRGFEEASGARALGLRYVLLPVTAETLTDSTFDTFRRILREGGTENLFVHCASGNRVGALLLPWLVLDQHWTVERATPLVESTGLRSEELRARALDYIARHMKLKPARR